MTQQDRVEADVRAVIAEGRSVLGIELGSTRIKAALIGPGGRPIASASHAWENQLVEQRWTYALDAVWEGLQACYSSMIEETERLHGVRPSTYAAIGVSAMMHGYLAFDAEDNLLVPFRTWRNSSTAEAARRLTQLFGHNIPLRWSVAHLYQAVLDEEPHVHAVNHLTTLAGYVHSQLTGRRVLGVGDASGMFPIDVATGSFDADLLARFDGLVADEVPDLHLAELLPQVLVAGKGAGRLTEKGASLLDPTGALQAGAALCPPEGDAGTGMVATNAVAKRTGNVSVGTSIFAMVVLEKPLQRVHAELDVVTTPAGDPVAMVHCNNGASEMGAWASVFMQFAELLGRPTEPDEVFAVLLQAALAGDPDGGGLLAYNYLSGEPITDLSEGRPLVVRTPDSDLTLANFMRAQVYGAFATLSLGMRTLAEEGVDLDAIVAHGGMFRTRGVAQRLLAAALDTPVAVGLSASEGGAWGMAVLAQYACADDAMDLADFLDAQVFQQGAFGTVEPDPDDRAGFAVFLERYRAGLVIERSATAAV